MAQELNPYRLNDELALLGRTLVAQLFVLFKTSLNYSEGHAALDAPVDNVLNVVREILRTKEEASLRVRGGNLYLADLRLKHDAAGFEASRFVMEEMKRHLVGGISFNLAVTADDLRRFVYALREVDGLPSPDNYSEFLRRMQQRMIVNIEVETVHEEGDTVEIGNDRLNLRLNSSKHENGKLKAKVLYGRAIAAMDEVMGNAGAGQTLRLREPKRVVQRMIDLLSSHEAFLVGLTTMRCNDAYTENHAVNVCILSLAMGKRLGLSKFQLCELGVAALFHDIGKVEIPREILEKPGELSADEQLTLEAHPLHGVKKVMKLKGLDAMTSRILTGVFEHHLLADFSGYPRFPYQRLSLLGRIIGIADCYDGLTSARVAGRTPCTPAKALRVMIAGAGKAYDQGLLKLLINCVGIHGIGSLLLLDSHELAVVVENNPDPALWDNPRVRIVADANGREVDGEIVDLALSHPTRLILANLDPRPFNLDVSRYFL
ncbi:MAG: diguanylate phosphodiesterase [Geobacteraceae bacterium GWC2_58_44]|nr:MAG: diguanylate phosphodiesterase [Geobacteraceae bacterium GWC2_58_44]HBG05219.1 diguanylate phosphodiesterase [Geobacter sp.]